MAEADNFNILPLILSKKAEKVEGISRIAEATSVEEMFLNEKPFKPIIPKTFDDIVLNYSRGRLKSICNISD